MENETGRGVQHGEVFVAECLTCVSEQKTLHGSRVIAELQADAHVRMYQNHCVLIYSAGTVWFKEN